MAEEQHKGEPLSGKESSARMAQQQALASYKSSWPLLLAVALFVSLIGLLANLVVFIVGVTLLLVAVIGWGVERR